MDNKDNLGNEIKKIMEEETADIVLSHTTLNNILTHKKKTLKEKINEFLNMEIEIPMAPAIAVFAVLAAFILIKGSMLKLPNERIIDIGGSQVIIREDYEVGMK